LRRNIEPRRAHIARVAIGPSQGHNECGKDHSDPGNDDGGFSRHDGPRFYDLKKLRAVAILALTWIKALSVSMEPGGVGRVNGLRNRLNHFVMERV
jgi:hypothetical protein